MEVNILKKRQLGITGIEVTPVGFGVLTVGINQLNLPVDEGAAIIRHALERGINFLDTAQFYKTYPYIKRALQGSTLDPVIVTKSYMAGYQEMSAALEEARYAMDRDTIDIFLLHEVRSRQDFDNRRGAWEFLIKAKQMGMVKAIGLSTHHIDVADFVSDLEEADVLFPLINLAGLGIRKGQEPGAREEMELAIKKAAIANKGVFAMKVFGGGILLNRYQEAFAYASNLEGVTSLMVGFGSLEEVDCMFDLMEGRIQTDYVPDLSKKRIMIDQVDCEACLACMRKCPNKAIFVNTSGLAEIDPTLCLSCGYCAPVCPVRAIIML